VANRLQHETSPYLLQHANNPVDWYPWGPEALARAAAEDRPILLSIGYSACHWCHVMERESFEDKAVAVLMNRDFVCVKVDREERPDLDEVYMRAVQAFTGGHGGWPATLFLTPAGEPYFGGTYFPPTRGRGLPSFREVLGHAAGMYRTHRSELAEVATELVDYLRASGRMPDPSDTVGGDWLATISTAAAADFDATRGGFGGAPKFPPHGTLQALLVHHQQAGDAPALTMGLKTLDQMALGGMYDLLAGGFARYSVDVDWRIPHFEKMLYDQAQLVPSYVDAWKLTGDPAWRRVAVETLDWVLRDMTHPGGGFAASVDADSEGEEGLYYTWTPRQLREVLGILDGARAATLLGVSDAGTFEHGTSVLRLGVQLERLNPDDQELVSKARIALLRTRQQRVAPARDDKVVTAWNAMMLSAFARAGAAFGMPAYIDAARRSARFLLSELTVDGRLLRTWKDGRAHLLGYLDDHANLVDALLHLFEATGEAEWLDEALALSDRMVDLFWDQDDGGFWYTGRDATALVARSKHLMGGAEPSGNGVAALAMLRLANLCGRDDLADRADVILRSYRPLLERAPRALGLEAVAAAWAGAAPAQLAIIGDAAAPGTLALLAEARRHYRPLTAIAPLAAPDDRLPWTAGKDSSTPTAWLCHRGACQLPTGDPSTLAEQLTARPATPAAVRPTRDHAPALPSESSAWLNTTAPLSLESLRGRIVVLDFWTSCCVNCLHVLPELAAIEATYHAAPVAVIGVHSPKFPAEQDPANVQAAISRHRIRHPVVLDPDHSLWSAYTVRSWPTVVVLDPTGRIAWRQEGEVSRQELAVVIDRLLNEFAEAAAPPPAQEATPIVPSPAPSSAPLSLRHPGKVHVYPDAAAQAVGSDPLSPDARLYIADTGNDRIVEAALRLDAEGWPEATFLRSFGGGNGLKDGPSDQALFDAPQGVARAGRTLWVADTGNHCLRSINLDTGEVTTRAGTGSRGTGPSVTPEKPLTQALRSPWDLAVVGPNGQPPAPDAPCEADVVFIAMAGSHQVWVYVTSNQRLGPFLGSGREDHVDGGPTEAALAQPSGLCLFGRYLFIADSEVSSVRVFDLAERKVGTVVGAGLFDWGDHDGVGGEVRLQHPLGITLADGSLYVADTFNHKVKAIEMDGGRTTTVGTATPTQLRNPGGIAPLGAFLVVADTDNHRLVAVRRSDGEMRTLALR
jgi:uncharacterized protein